MLLPPLARAVGACVAALHNAGIAHGDLTSSNFIVRQGEGGGQGVGEGAAPDVFIIDFGLSFNR